MSVFGGDILLVMEVLEGSNGVSVSTDWKFVGRDVRNARANSQYLEESRLFISSLFQARLERQAPPSTTKDTNTPNMRDGK